MSKPKVAICWLGGCGGCDEAIVDLNEQLLEVATTVDIVFWPIALDYKYKDVQEAADGSIDLVILNGSLRNTDNEEVGKLLRRKARLVMAFGTCACFGGTPGMANWHDNSNFTDWAYQNAPTVCNPGQVRPQTESIVNGHVLTIPALQKKVYILKDKIEIDYFLPGCCPPPDLILKAINNVLENKLPPRGSTLAPHKALCHTCPRNNTKPTRIKLKEIKRIHQIEAKDDICFLAQGIFCYGPATRTGCGETCININLPCRGCFGATEEPEHAPDRFISSLAGMLDITKDEDIEKVIEQIGDLAGYLYRFCLSASALDRKEG